MIIFLRTDSLNCNWNKQRAGHFFPCSAADMASRAEKIGEIGLRCCCLMCVCASFAGAAPPFACSLAHVVIKVMHDFMNYNKKTLDASTKITQCFVNLRTPQLENNTHTEHLSNLHSRK